jgi:transcriptional regulator with XRE-family HTH domain
MRDMAHASAAGGPPPIGQLLQYWRKARSLSQLALAYEAAISPRHLSFLETGRAKPSRDMVLLLAEALSVPLREKNAFLLAAGFAPMFRESTLEDPALAPVRMAIDAILSQQEPFPAVVMNRGWDIVRVNDAASTFFAALFDGRTAAGAGNVVRMMFHPDGLRPCVVDWESVGRALVGRMHREAVGGALDEDGRKLLEEVLGYPDVPARWRTPDLGEPLLPVVPVSFRLKDQTFNFFSAVTVLGTPQDVTVQEIRVESFFPLDEETAAAARALASQRRAV